jgi:hydroxymethylpyrimidine/phosphomethylpyrimidine kinase
MRATLGSGQARLLDPAARAVLRDMTKHVTLVTPNVPEVEALLGARVRSVEDAERAARALVALGARAALVKGGHLPDRPRAKEVTDVLVVGRRIVRLRAPRIGAAVHGTGCTLSSLVAGRLARTGASDDAVVEAVRWAKRKLRRALAHPVAIGDGLRVIAP